MSSTIPPPLPYHYPPRPWLETRILSILPSRYLQSRHFPLLFAPPIPPNRHWISSSTYVTITDLQYVHTLWHLPVLFDPTMYIHFAPLITRHLEAILPHSCTRLPDCRGIQPKWCVAQYIVPQIFLFRLSLFRILIGSPCLGLSYRDRSSFCSPDSDLDTFHLCEFLLACSVQ